MLINSNIFLWGVKLVIFCKLFTNKNSKILSNIKKSYQQVAILSSRRARVRVVLAARCAGLEARRAAESAETAQRTISVTK